MVITTLSNLSKLPDKFQVPPTKTDWLILLGNCGVINQAAMYNLVGYKTSSGIKRLIYMIGDEDYYLTQNPEIVDNIRPVFDNHGVHIHRFGESFKYDDIRIGTSGKEYTEVSPGVRILLTLRPPARFRGSKRLPKRGCLRTTDFIQGSNAQLFLYSHDAWPSYIEQLTWKTKRVGNCNMRSASGKIIYRPIRAEL